MVGQWNFVPRFLLSLALLLSVSPVFASTSVGALTNINNQALEYASRFYLDGKAKLTPSQQKDMDCLAKAIFFEARGESYTGKLMVANVIQNRIKFGKPFATTICKVVYQPHQFSWTRNKWKRNTTFRVVAHKFSYRERQEILDTTKIALSIVLLQTKPKTSATHFSTGSFRFGQLIRLAKVGNHVFYRYTGNP